jgi:hypothetical protein
MQRLCAGNGKRNSGTWEENFGTLQLCVNQWQQVLDRSPLLAAAKGFCKSEKIKPRQIDGLLS